MAGRFIIAGGLALFVAACASTASDESTAACRAESFAVYFARDQVAVDDIGERILDSAADRIAGCAGARLEVAGFADPAGDAQINDRLSAQRADAVLAALLARGVSAEQVEVLAVGERGARTDGGVTEPMRRRVQVNFIPAGS
jgi:OOP family OmpA-OmpF porin